MTPHQRDPDVARLCKRLCDLDPRKSDDIYINSHSYDMFSVRLEAPENQSPSGKAGIDA